MEDRAGTAVRGIMYDKRYTHVSFKCSGEQLRRVIAFYSDTLGIPIIRRWGPDCDSPIGVMFDTGNGIIEVFLKCRKRLAARRNKAFRT